MVDISIVIRAKNEAKSIGKALDMVFKQKIDKEFEVLIIDTDSTDSTIDIALSYGCRIINVPSEAFTYPHALNIGAKNARGKYIVYLSAHSPPVNDRWLYHLTKNFSDPLVAGIYGRQIPIKDLNPIEEIELLRYYPLNGQDVSKYAFSNANSAIRKDIWLKYPFDEFFFLGPDDVLWAKKVIEHGYNITYQPLCLVYHSHPFSFHFIKKRFNDMYYVSHFLKDIPSVKNKNRIIEKIKVLSYGFSYLLANRYIKYILIYPIYLSLLQYAVWKGKNEGLKT